MIKKYNSFVIHPWRWTYEIELRAELVRNDFNIKFSEITDKSTYDFYCSWLKRIKMEVARRTISV